MNVLIVGVAAEWRSIIAAALGGRGHVLLEAVDLVGAVEIVRRSAPALVVIEDAPARTTATSLCRAIRASPLGDEAVILVLTPHLAELGPILDAGATDVYATTLGPQALEARVIIAERLVAQHARLRDREVRFRRLFESGVAGVVISDLAGNFKEANEAFLQLLGYTSEDMLAGKLRWETITPAERLPIDGRDRLQLRATGFLPLRERAYLHKDGRTIAVLVGSAALQGTTEYINYVTDISGRKHAEEALCASEEQYRALFEHSPFPKFLFDHETLRFLAVNDTALQSYGYTREEMLGMTLLDIKPREDFDAVVTSLAALPPGTTRIGVGRHKKKDGTFLEVELTVHKFELGHRPCCVLVAVDLTQRNLLEGQLRQAQKMEAIGSLAGGVAHDFNNILSVILSYSEILADGLNPDDPMREDIEAISAAGRRAAGLTGQLLAFSRQQILQPTVVDLTAVINGVLPMLKRVVGEDVEISVVAATSLGVVKADAGQMEQVLMNLVVNSRDAMPTGGKLTIETANVELDHDYAQTHPGTPEGPCVMLAVSDTGTGMDAKTRERIFEPFFTTKDVGKGTGLGLSTAFGIVRQSGGSIWVYSELGEGTTFRVYLPRLGGDVAAVPTEKSDDRPRRGSETVLLVEDDTAVRAVTRTILERQGYHVLEAQSGGDALLLCEQHRATIHVLVTDVVMARMSGRQLAKRLGRLRPEMKVLYMSGYTEDAVVRHGVLNSDVAFLQKPITPHALSRKLREVIAAGKVTS